MGIGLRWEARDAQGTNEVCEATIEEKFPEFDREAPRNALFQAHVYPKPQPRRESAP